MGYIKYAEQLETKLKKLGIVRLKKKLMTDKGFFEEGTYFSPISVLSCNEDGTECCLRLTTYYKTSYASSEVRFKNFKIEEWFESADTINALDRMISDTEERRERICNSIFIVSLVISIILAIVAVTWCCENGIVSTTADIRTDLLIVCRITVLTLITIMIIYAVSVEISNFIYGKKLSALNKKLENAVKGEYNESQN